MYIVLRASNGGGMWGEGTSKTRTVNTMEDVMQIVALALKLIGYSNLPALEGAGMLQPAVLQCQTLEEFHLEIFRSRWRNVETEAKVF